MTLTKKEKILLVILAVVVYIFVFTKFVLISAIPKIKDVKGRIHTVQAQLDALENDYNNLSRYKEQIKETETIDERLGEYLMDDASMSDSVEFVENLSLLIGRKLKSISLGDPKQMTIGESDTYYAFPVRFRTVLTEEGLNELLRFIEGGSRKISVSSLNIKLADPATASEYGITDSSGSLFDVNMGIVFYSLNKNSADSFAEFTRSAFERFIEKEGLPVFIEELKDNSEINVPAAENTENTKTANAARNSNTSAGITLLNSDFKIFHTGFLYGGYNFETYSQFDRQNRIRTHIKVPVKVTLTLGQTQYTIEYADENGYTDALTGDLPANENRNYTFYIQSDVLDGVKENENLRVNLYIRNDSGKSINVKLEQSGDRVNVMDRDGNAIEQRSDKEKVYIL